MCYVQLALAAASAIDQRGKALEVRDHQKLLHERNRQLAGRQAARQQEALSRQTRQGRQATAQQIDSTNIQAAQAKADATVAAAESGSQGESVDLLNRDFARQQAMASATLVRNQEFRDQAAKSQASAVQDNQSAAVINSLPPPVQLPTFLGAALRIAGAADLDSFGRKTSSTSTAGFQSSAIRPTGRQAVNPGDF